MKNLFAAMFTIVFFALPLAGFAAPEGAQQSSMWHGMEGIGWGWLGLGFLHMAVFWGVIILAFAGVFRLAGGDSLSEPGAMEILKARYAKGDLTREQYDKLKGEIG